MNWESYDALQYGRKCYSFAGPDNYKRKTRTGRMLQHPKPVRVFFADTIELPCKGTERMAVRAAGQSMHEWTAFRFMKETVRYC